VVPLATLLEPANSWMFYFELLEFISDDAISRNESVDTLTCVFYFADDTKISYYYTDNFSNHECQIY